MLHIGVVRPGVSAGPHLTHYLPGPPVDRGGLHRVVEVPGLDEIPRDDPPGLDAGSLDEAGGSTAPAVSAVSSVVASVLSLIPAVIAAPSHTRLTGLVCHTSRPDLGGGKFSLPLSPDGTLSASRLGDSAPGPSLRQPRPALEGLLLVLTSCLGLQSSRG